MEFTFSSEQALPIATWHDEMDFTSSGTVNPAAPIPFMMQTPSVVGGAVPVAGTGFSVEPEKLATVNFTGSLDEWNRFAMIVSMGANSDTAFEYKFGCTFGRTTTTGEFVQPITWGNIYSAPGDTATSANMFFYDKPFPQSFMTDASITGETIDDTLKIWPSAIRSAGASATTRDMMITVILLPSSSGPAYPKRGTILSDQRYW